MSAHLSSGRRGVARVSSRSCSLSVVVGLVLTLLTVGIAHAQTFPLTMELQIGQLDDFGVVHVEADADGALVFEVEMHQDRVGDPASIRRLFFNLLPETTGVWVEPLDESEDTVERLVVRRANRKLARSGARLDWRLDFHAAKTPGENGSAALQFVRFRLFADAPLTVEDLLPVSLTRSGEPVQMVVTLQRGRTPEGDRVRWAAGVYEPPSEPPVLN